jgi:hypothetical protein
MSATWLSNPWLCWGVGPYLASNVSFLLTAAVLELVASCMPGSLLTYASSSNTPRQKLLVETHKRLPFRYVCNCCCADASEADSSSKRRCDAVSCTHTCRKQLQGSLKFILGIPTIGSTFGLAVAMQLAGVTATSWLPDTALQTLLQLLMLAVLADLGLYWGESSSLAAAAVA